MFEIFYGNYSKNTLVFFILVIVRERSSHECKSTSFAELQNTVPALVLAEPGGSNELVWKVEGFRFFFFFLFVLGKHVCFE